LADDDGTDELFDDGRIRLLAKLDEARDEVGRTVQLADELLDVLIPSAVGLEEEAEVGIGRL
jgi:hypothetical protein